MGLSTGIRHHLQVGYAPSGKLTQRVLKRLDLLLNTVESAVDIGQALTHVLLSKRVALEIIGDAVECVDGLVSLISPVPHLPKHLVGRMQVERD